MRLRSPLLLSLIASALAFVPLSAVSARDPATPEQRIERLERQVRQVQRQVFPKGQPADTAGFSDAPAATQESVSTLYARLDAIERQMADLVRSSEENSHRLSVLETDLARMRAENDTRFKALEAGPGGVPPATDPNAPPTTAPAPATDAPTAVTTPPPPVYATPAPTRRPRTPAPTPDQVTTAAVAPGSADFTAGGEAAYDAGFNLWQAKKYDAAITQLRAMASSFPGHRRVSWANNLIGRALLDKGQPRAAAEALLANYRSNPKGERAPDSLFYLGQSLVKLGQLGQACKAYDELTNVYGDTARPELRKMIGPARAQAQCK